MKLIYVALSFPVVLKPYRNDRVGDFIKNDDTRKLAQQHGFPQPRPGAWGKELHKTVEEYLKGGCYAVLCCPGLYLDSSILFCADTAEHETEQAEQSDENEENAGTGERATALAWE